MAKEIGQIDPDVRVPAAVKAASARADERHKAAYGGEADPPAEPENEGVDPDVTSEGNDPAPEPEADPPVDAGGQDDPPPPEGNDPEPRTDEQSWEHAYKSMKGRHDKAQQQIAGLTDRIHELESQLTSAKKAPKTDDPAPDVSEKLVTAEEEADYGSEFLDVVARKAKEIYGPTVGKLQGRIDELEGLLGQVSERTHTSARESLITDLDREVSNWRELNHDQNFLSWLQLKDPFSGVIRQKLLTEAFEQNNSPRVLAFFKGFLSEEAAVAPAEPESDPKAGQSNSPDTPKVPLESLAAPGRAKTSAAPTAPAAKPTFSRADIAKFYADVAAGKYRGKEDDKNKLEKDIFEAKANGRIT